MLVIASGPNNKYIVFFYGARLGKTFDCWESKLMSLSQATALRLRIERRHKVHIGKGQ